MQGNTKHKRQMALLEIVRKNRIRTQEELGRQLKKMGFEFTQATLSRDIKNMGIARVNNKTYGYIYVIPNENVTESHGEGFFPAEGFLSIDFSHNIAVVKTLVGYANAVASGLDRLNFYEILGTIAGDDTIMIILKEGISRRVFIENLARQLPEIQFKIYGMHHEE